MNRVYVRSAGTGNSNIAVSVFAGRRFRGLRGPEPGFEAEPLQIPVFYFLFFKKMSLFKEEDRKILPVSLQ